MHIKARATSRLIRPFVSRGADMPRNIQGKAVKQDVGAKKLDTEQGARSEYPVESRKAEPKQSKGKDRADNKVGTAHETSGDTDNHPDARKNPAAFPAGPEAMQLHHDRLQRIEDHLGLKPKTDNMKGEDQARMGKGKEVGHVTEKKGTPPYARKHHS